MRIQLWTHSCLHPSPRTLLRAGLCARVQVEQLDFSWELLEEAEPEQSVRK